MSKSLSLFDWLVSWSTLIRVISHKIYLAFMKISYEGADCTAFGRSQKNKIIHCIGAVVGSISMKTLLSQFKFKNNSVNLKDTMLQIGPKGGYIPGSPNVVLILRDFNRADILMLHKDLFDPFFIFFFLVCFKIIAKRVLKLN